MVREPLTRRRRILKATGAGLAAGLAGCVGLNNGGSDEDLERTDAVEEVENKLPEYADYPDDYWETIARAEQEGTLDVYTAHFGALSESIFEAFNEFAPFVDVNITNLPTAKVFQRFSSEAAQDRWEPDVIHTYDPIALNMMTRQDLLMDYDSPEHEFYSEEWFTPNGVALCGNYSFFLNTFNPSKVEEEGLSVDNLPNSLEELANAVEGNPGLWDQNFATYDGTLSTSAWQQMYGATKVYGKDKAIELYKKIAKGNPKAFWSTSTMGEWVATGDVMYGYKLVYFISEPFVKPDYPEEQFDDMLSKDLIGGGSSGGYQVVRKPDNPGAAKLFYDWYYSKQGQLHLANDWYFVSTSSAIKPDEVKADYNGTPITNDWVREQSATWVPFRELSESGSEKQDLKNTWYEIFVAGTA